MPIALRNFGYQSGEYEVYSQTKARNDIKKGQPVYASGFNKHLDGHAWVLDGTQSMMQTEIWQIDYWYEGKLQGSELVKRNPNYWDQNIHVNYGWGGRSDFWSSGNFFQYTSPSGEYLNFNSGLGMITGIKPNR